MDICIACDENYVCLVKVLLVSIFENNFNEMINIHIFGDDISQLSQNQLCGITKKYHMGIRFYDANDLISSIRNNIKNNWAIENSYTAYARIFMPNVLDEKIDKFLYLDCDTLVMGNLREIYDVDIVNYYAAAVEDVLPNYYVKNVLPGEAYYYNSGVMLINAKRWRQNNIGEKIIDYCTNNPNALYPDQDAINYVLLNNVLRLDPKFCVFYPDYAFPAKVQQCAHGKRKSYYTMDQLKEAISSPLIIHYVDSVWGRPWQKNNINPYSKYWLSYYNKLENDQKFEFDLRVLSHNLEAFRYISKVVNISMFAKLYYWRRDKGLKKRMRGI